MIKYLPYGTRNTEGQSWDSAVRKEIPEGKPESITVSSKTEAWAGAGPALPSYYSEFESRVF